MWHLVSNCVERAAPATFTIPVGGTITFEWEQLAGDPAPTLPLPTLRLSPTTDARLADHVVTAVRPGIVRVVVDKDVYNCPHQHPGTSAPAHSCRVATIDITQRPRAKSGDPSGQAITSR